jgi:hypothetical protein
MWKGCTRSDTFGPQASRVKLERLDEPWIRTDADFINDDKFLAIDQHNALELRGKAYLVLLACAGWARMHPKSGNWVPNEVFDDLCARLWPTLQPQQLAHALADRRVRLIKRGASAIKLERQGKWQLSPELSATRSAAGRRGAFKRWQSDSKSMASAMQSPDDSKQMALAMERESKNGERDREEERNVTSLVKASDAREHGIVGLVDDAAELCGHLSDALEEWGAKGDVTQAWQLEAERLLRIDKRSIDEAIEVLDWATHDDFWRPNIRSMSKFRKQYDTLRGQMMRRPTTAADRLERSVEADLATAAQLRLEGR